MTEDAAEAYPIATCFHEAGHAIVGAALGLEVVNIRINKDDESSSRAWRMVQSLCRPNGAGPYSRSGSTKAKLAVVRCACRKSDSPILVMKAAEDRL
jgi:hypothetical protein